MSIAADNLAKLAAMFREGTTPHQLAVDALKALETAHQDAPCASVDAPRLVAIEGAGCKAPGEAATFSGPMPVWVAQASEIRSAKKKRKQAL